MQHRRDMNSALNSSQKAAVIDRATTPLEQLGEALGRLTMPPEHRLHIPACAQALLNVNGIYAAKDTPRARIGGTKKVRKELEILGKLAGDLHDHIASMHGDALKCVRDQSFSDDGQRLAAELLAVGDGAGSLVRPILRALRKLASAAESLPGPRGRRHRAAAVTAEAARVYERLTGKRPTISVYVAGRPHARQDYGPFLDLLAETFHVLNVRASPESQARAFLGKNTTKKRPHNSFGGH
jgi:hypothetical protein